jgi:heme-degrading monooxygenase HmoA
MRALFFEVMPKPGHEDHYFGIAAALKARVEQYRGLLFLDRYRSLTRPATILSYQHWRDEASIVAWREDAKHFNAQNAGREKHFADYRLRIAEIVDGFVRANAGTNAFSGEASDNDRYVMAVESEAEPFPRGEPFESVNRKNVFASVLHISGRGEGDEILRDAGTQDFVTRAILCRVDRDYGMFDRKEAPQEFPALRDSSDTA